LPVPANFAGLAPMGAKYLPTTRDQKASQRFQQKQNTSSKFIVSSGKPPAKPAKKK